MNKAHGYFHVFTQVRTPWCSEVSNPLYRGCDRWIHVLSDYQSVMVYEAQTPISGAFESISSLDGKQKRLELA